MSAVVSPERAESAPLAAGKSRGSLTARKTVVAAALVLLAVLVVRMARRPEPVPNREATGLVVFVDTAGWYGRTPNEVAVVTPHELTIDALPASLPLTLGPWSGADRPHDVAADLYLSYPEVSIERTYWREDGEIVWLTVFGSRGAKSFRLFEHTPETCYPLDGWSVGVFGPILLPLGPRPLPVNRGIALGPDGELVFLYFYLWNSPDRDSDRGVLTCRIAAPVSATAERTLAMLADDFVPLLLGPTIAWSRF